MTEKKIDPTPVEAVEPIEAVEPVETVEHNETIEPVEKVEPPIKKARKQRRKKKEIDAERLADKINAEIESNMVVVPEAVKPVTTSKVDGSKPISPAGKKAPFDTIKIISLAILGVGILAVTMYLFRSTDKRVDVLIVGQSETHSENEEHIFS